MSMASKNPVLENLICKGVLTLEDFHRVMEELRILAHQMWEKAENKDGRDFWDEAEKQYFRYHFVGDESGKERAVFGLNREVKDW